MGNDTYNLKDLNGVFKSPEPFEMDLPWGDYAFSRRFLNVVHDWGIPTEQEIDFLAGYLKSGDTVLDLACGGGRHAIGLARLGYIVNAVEIGGYPLEAASRIAMEKKYPIKFEKRDIRKIEYNEEFNLAFLICGQLGHFSPEDSRRIFINSAKALKVGGTLIIHLMAFNDEDRASYVQWYREKKPFYFEHPSVVHREQYYIPDQRVKIIRDFAVDTVTRQNRLFGISEKYYSENDLREFANAAGLDLSEKYGDYLKTPLNEKSQSNIYIFRKN